MLVKFAIGFHFGLYFGFSNIEDSMSNVELLMMDFMVDLSTPKFLEEDAPSNVPGCFVALFCTHTPLKHNGTRDRIAQASTHT